MKSIKKRVSDSILPDTYTRCSYLFVKKRWYAYLSWKNTGRYYDSRINPFDIYWISPGEINKYLLYKNRFHEHGNLVSEVIRGDWDQEVDKFNNLDVYKAIKKRYEKNIDWPDTEFYQRVIKEIRGGNNKWGCNSINEFEIRCENIDKLIRSIDKIGYVSQKKLYDNYCCRQSQYSSPMKPGLVEITVDIDRNGNYLFVDGRHRLSIAKVIGIDSVPVQIKARHKKWQDKRERAYHQEQSVSNHPDLINI